MMKQALYILTALFVLAACTTRGSHRHSYYSENDDQKQRLYELISEQPEQAMVFIDSMEAAGVYSEAMANCRRAQLYSEQYQPRVSEMYALRALKTQQLKEEQPDLFYLTYNMLINAAQNIGNTEKALQYATRALNEAKTDTNHRARLYEPDFLSCLANAQFKLEYNKEGAKNYERAYAAYEATLNNAPSFSWFYPEFMMTVDAITDYITIDNLQTADVWLARMQSSYDRMVATKDIPDYVRDDCTAQLELTKAKFYAARHQTREAAAHFRTYKTTDFSKTAIGRKSAAGYLETTGRWHELAEAVEASDSFAIANDSRLSVEYLLQVLKRRFTAQQHLGQTDAAMQTAGQLMGMIDSVWEASRRDDAAELLVVYETQEKEQQIAEQQATLSQQRWLATVVALVLITVFFVVYTLYRRRVARRMAEMKASQERMESELRIARDIQMSMVPSEFPKHPALDMYAAMTPAREVGGDLYGYVYSPAQEPGAPDRLYFVVGDVSGKGVPASLFMAQATRLFRTLATQGMAPAEICTRMNEALSGDDNANRMFVTMFVGLIDLQSGHLQFCNAGHNPPVIGGTASHGDFLHMKPNAPIGLWPGLNYEGEEISSIKGHPLFIYTDGLNEAENPQQEQFGEERLLDILRSTRFCSARQVIETLTDEVARHRATAEPNDDLTMMCIHVD